MTLKVLEQSISSLYKTGEGSPLEEALEAYRSRLQEKEAILVNEQQVTNTKTRSSKTFGSSKSKLLITSFQSSKTW